MGEMYLIKGETLTAIADAIRENAPNSWEGYEMFPIEMPDMIADVRREGYDEGYEAGKAEGGGGEPSQVTDLTGTVWKLNTKLVKLPSTKPYNIDFTSNGTAFVSIKYTTAAVGSTWNFNYVGTDGTSTLAYSSLRNDWMHYNYRIIEISGGTDATNTALIDWLYANGELLSKGSYDDGFANGQNSILSEFADWSLSTTSNSCTVSITNTHTSLYLHLEFYVMELRSGGEYEASVVIEPDSSYSWDSGDWCDSLSGAEWDICITGMRFSKNGV